MSNELRFVTYHNPGSTPVHFEAGGFKFMIPPHGNVQIPTHLEYVIERRGLHLKKLGNVDSGNDAEGPRDPVARQWWQRAVQLRDDNEKLAGLVRGLEKDLHATNDSLQQLERDHRKLREDLAQAERERDLAKREVIDLKHGRPEVRTAPQTEGDRFAAPSDIHGEPVSSPPKPEPKPKRNG